MKRQKVPAAKKTKEPSKDNKQIQLNYAQIVFDKTTGESKPIVRQSEEKCVYTEVHPVSLPEHKPLQPKPPAYMNIAKPRLAYESVTLGSDDTANNPEMVVYEVLEGHKCASMSEKRLIVKRGDFVQAGKTEAVRALCMLVDQPDSLMGWIPLEKLKLVYTNTTDMNPDTSSPIPIKQVPALPPKSPDLIQAIKSPSNGQKFGFVGVMDRATCEKMFKEKAKEQNFVVRESTHRVGDYTLSIQHTGKVHHFPIQFTEDQKYFIGQYKFKNLSHIVSYYQQNALFCDDKKKYVLLGEPLMPTDKHKPPQSK